MPAYQDKKTRKWSVQFRYKDYKGEVRHKEKRGFNTKKEALAYEEVFKKLQNGAPDLLFGDFAEKYIKDMECGLKQSTMDNRINVIRTKLIPAFGKKKLTEITNKDIKDWQNELLQVVDPKTGEKYKSSYLKSIRTVLSTMLNHAVVYYNLPKNVLNSVKGFRLEESPKVDFWTLDEFKRFLPTIACRPEEYLAFEILYWTGIRKGELLALTPSDFDFEKKTVTISKTLYNKNGKVIITPPKTKKSNRTIFVPDEVLNDIEVYFSMIYKMDPHERMFTISKDSLTRTMIYGCNQSKVKRIRIHDLRHSHVSLLINLGFSAIAIADRMGHETIDITFRYAHLFPSVQKDIVNKLNAL